MRIIKKIVSLICFLFFAKTTIAQEAAAVDSIKAMLAKAKTPAEKVE